MASRESETDSSSEMCYEDAQQLLEELQMQHEELEAQNEELRLAQGELERTKSEQIEFYHLAPIGYLTLDNSLRIIEGNEAVARLFNIDARHLVGSHITRFVPHECQVHFLEHLDRAREKATASIDLRLGRIDTFIAHLITYVVSNGNGQKYRMIVEDISDVKKAQMEAEESERRYRSFVQQSTDGVSLTDEEGRLIEWNKGLERITGLQREQVIGRFFWEVQWELMLEERKRDLSIEAVKESMIEALHTSQAPFFNRTLEAIFRRADGEIRRNSQTAFPIKTRRGHMIGSIVRDVTEKKEAEEALRESEERFRQIFNSTNDALFVTDLQGRFLEVNKAACQQLGYTKEELLNMGPTQITPPETAAGIAERMADTAKKGRLIFETIHLTEDGKQIPIELSIRSISYRGTPAILGVARDITERKKAEEELQTSMERFFLILSSMSYGVLLVTDNDRIEFANQAFCEMFNLKDSPDDLSKLSASEMLEKIRLSYSDPDEAVARIAELIRLEHSAMGEDVDMLDGRTLLRDFVPIRIGGRQYGRLWIHVDITERKKMEGELRRSNTALQQFAYAASHDLREPLRTVASFLQLLEKKYDDKILDENAKEYIGYAVDSANRMQHMISDLLAYSRIETRGKPFSEVDMNDALAIALKDLRTSIEESGAMITQGDLPTVMADKSQMILLLENLIGNAIRFRAQEAPQIHICAKHGRKNCIFAVRDNGIGIGPPYQERIFDMFQRLHTRDEYEGTGIGLAVAKKIVERHGGRIWVESEEGKGSTFFFTISR